MGRQLLALVLFVAAASAQSFSFRTPVTYSGGQGPVSTAVGNFNGGNSIGLAVADAAASKVATFLGRLDGTFSSLGSVTIPNQCVANSVTAGDFTNDGKADLLVVCGFQTSMWVVPSLGNGLFGAPVLTTLPQAALAGAAPFAFRSVVVADFNHDGKLDVVLAASNNVVSDGTLFPDELLLFPGKGDGTFQSPSTLFLPGLVCFNVVAADFNNDGIPDLAVDSYPSQSSGGQTATLQILLGNGGGGFTPGATYALPGVVIVGSLIAADVNQDGVPDLLAASSFGLSSQVTSYLSVLTGKGDGTFRPLANTTLPQPVLGLTVGDFRGTGKADLVEYVDPNALAKGSGLVIQNTSMMIRAGNGDGTFQSPVALSVPAGLVPFSFDSVARDFNGDGLADLAFTAIPPTTTGPESGSGGQVVVAAYQLLPAGSLVVLLNQLPPTEPVISLAYQPIQLSAQTGGTSASQSVTISNAGAGALQWTATASANWITVTPASGTGTTAVTITASPGSLPVTTHYGTVTFSAVGAANSPQVVSVEFIISNGAPTPQISIVENGASFVPMQIEPGSWVTIKGSNLSNTNPGRTWTSAEIVNGKLPTSLDGTSVTIGGQPAFVYYISPTQINVQAPDFLSSIPVQVIVTNNGLSSLPAQTQALAAAPGFFMYSGTSYAITTRYLDNALIGNPGAVPGTIPAKPGDVLIFWATGFGATSPPTAAGTVVTSAASVATLPIVTVGGMPVTVIGAALSPGSVGLYQVAVQLPSNVPTGDVMVEGSVSGFGSPQGILTYVASQ